jgi:hypothetical protein
MLTRGENLELTKIMLRIAEGIEHIDSTIQIPQRGRNVDAYRTGIAAMYERALCKSLVEWWKEGHTEDFKHIEDISREFPYPDADKLCDIVLRSRDYSDSNSWEWAVEIKRIQFIGDNGNNNDYGVGKLLSPYKKDASLAGDIVKLQQSNIANKKAVIAYVFNYSFETCKEALKRHPNEKAVVAALRDVCERNDSKNGEINAQDLIDVVEYSLKRWGIVISAVKVPFTAWRSPTGGNGLLFGWQV